MGMPLEAVQGEVRKAGRAAARARYAGVIAGEQGAQRSIVVERRVVRKFGNDKRYPRRLGRSAEPCHFEATFSNKHH